MSSNITEMKLQPGWLMKTCHRAKIECMSWHAPAFWANGPSKFTHPIPAAEADELFAMLDERFQKWTGHSLAEHIKSSDQQQDSGAN